MDDTVRELLDDLVETMHAAGGIGLAATQVDVHRRVLVVDVSDDRSAPQLFVNPEIVSTSLRGMSEESCLSLPGVTEVVARDLRARVRALDRDGQPFELEAEGLLAVCLQHEIEHLDGKLFVDRLSWLKRGRVRRQLAKPQRGGYHPFGLVAGPRTRLASALGLAAVLSMGVAAAFWPFYAGSRKMQGFCAELQVGAASAEVRAAAHSLGYELSDEIPVPASDGGPPPSARPVAPRAAGPVIVGDPRFDRFRCELTFGEDGRLAARRYNGD